jgi:hypothetical protein
VFLSALGLFYSQQPSIRLRKFRVQLNFQARSGTSTISVTWSSATLIQRNLFLHKLSWRCEGRGPKSSSYFVSKHKQSSTRTACSGSMRRHQCGQQFLVVCASASTPLMWFEFCLELDIHPFTQCLRRGSFLRTLTSILETMSRLCFGLFLSALLLEERCCGWWEICQFPRSCYVRRVCYSLASTMCAPTVISSHETASTLSVCQS